ncbi:L-type lectin-domain containing receptor kinase SIT2-like [Dioscorea cayenensis subsp. rotundata]|uniref:non-specific serine/threonine protein kinase n=1 Tax=Dioscorea cayennensis subsp. rotundata TaxID=55577 RepID=A0AB40BUU9_DIOCR|nr:L-type lectin-domain containing receptor kinase SIT2-like [Dioscorea cayenensis subsp. rotundata]
MQQLKVLLWILMAELATLATVDSFIFTNGFTNTKFILDGVASITENGVLKLTNDTKDATGHAIYPTPFNFLQPSTGKAVSFSTTFVFAIIPQEYYGDGMAFFIAPTANFSTAMARKFLGLFNSSDNGDSSNHIVAVELDTRQNIDNDDIDSNHIGIDINGVKSNLSHPAGYFNDLANEFHNLSLVSGEPMQVWVDYDGGEMKLNVTLSPIQIPKPKRPLLSMVVNLSSILFNSMYVGFSSSTGSLVSSDHCLLGWSFKLNGLVPEALNISTLPSLPEHAAIKEKPKYLTTIWLIVGSVFLLMSMAIAVILIMVRRRRIKFAELVEDWELQYSTHRFSYKTLFKATKGFNDKQLLGVGGFGKVYKGLLPKSNTEVAVKRVSHESRQGMTEFIAEIVTLGQLRHRNLVQLLGYCRRKGELLLVYDYMPNGNLGSFLHCKDRPALNWPQRLHIIKGVASGLQYLHEDWEQVVIHRDIKTNNVLLDSELNGRLSDFGLARLYDHDMDPQTTKVAGTMGYIAPELARTGRPTTLTDVFAFGVFVLEVACGRRPIDFKSKDDNQVVLVDWVLENWKKETILDSIDQRLGDEYNVDEKKLVLELGLLCSHTLPALRPSMKQVVQCLNGDAQLPSLSSLAFSNFNLLALQKNEGFDKYVLSHPNSSIPSSEFNIADFRSISSEGPSM